MGVLQGALVVVAIIVAGWAGYKAGWQARGAREKELKDSADRTWFELSLILLHRDEAALAKVDREMGTDALGRSRSMPAEALADLRRGRGALFDELSDWLAVRERRNARLTPRIISDPALAKIFSRMAPEGQPVGAPLG